MMSGVMELLGLSGDIVGDPEKAPVLVIMGATATGKSALAMELAEIIPAEIVSADSMQIYREMDIGVSKPTHEDRCKVPHHLLDVCEISEHLDVYRYVGLADAAICEIRKRCRIPLVVGGSGMYIRALLRGLDPLPSDHSLRMTLEQKYSSGTGFAKLRDLMSVKDPEAFAKLGHDRRKLARALEVNILTGKSIVSLQNTWGGGMRYNVRAWTICRDRAELKERIGKRTDAMLSSGWIDETEKLVSAGLLQSPTARQAIGYATISEFLDGKITHTQMRDRIVTMTCQYAKRQATWFRHQHPEAMPITNIPPLLPHDNFS
ncbi:MAG: tRNA (adenosine(37)-N6)-dimethylallyltransferase MiaA [Victivallales bacterium]|nr:tRNA (adenosine(37)-N6)-dimethylallyltransferase MiaA [Victivallales bacterium]